MLYIRCGDEIFGFQSISDLWHKGSRPRYYRAIIPKHIVPQKNLSFSDDLMTHSTGSQLKPDHRILNSLQKALSIPCNKILKKKILILEIKLIFLIRHLRVGRN